jgi:8-oxo-dGTP pyrophosphatase MutT (NUDIX family)
VQPPRVTSTRIVYENRWMRLREDRLEQADGRPGLYAYAEKPPSAVIVPVQDGHVWLIEQYRHPVGARFWEFPQGAWEDAPEAGAETLARGELQEETGLTAASMERLGALYFAYGLTDQEFTVWRATGLTEGPQSLESTEADLRVGRFPHGEVEAMVRDGRIRDAASVAAWHLTSAAPPAA